MDIPISEWNMHVLNAPRVGYLIENGHVTKLVLSGLNLAEIPNSIGNLTELRHLLLESNILKFVNSRRKRSISVGGRISGKEYNRNGQYRPR